MIHYLIFTIIVIPLSESQLSEFY